MSGLRILRHLPLWVLVGLACAWPGVACADEHRLFLGAVGGITFETSASSSAAFSASLSLSRSLTLTGEGGRVVNVLPASDRLTINAQALAAGSMLNGSPVVAGRLPVAYGLVTIRAGHPIYRGVRGYAEIGAGVARLSNQYVASVGTTDVSSSVLTTALLTSLPTTSPVIAAGAGVTLAPDSELSVDVGCRLLRILARAEAITTGQVYSAVHFRF